MKLFTDIRLLFLRPFLQNLHNPAFTFINLTTPLMYLVLFMPLLKKLAGPTIGAQSVVQIFLPGIIALLFATSGIFSAYPSIFELKKGLTERLRVTPASRFALLIGPILSWIAWTSISSAVIVGFSVPFGFHIHVFGLLLFWMLLSMLLTVFAAFSTWLVVVMKGEITSISGVLTGLNLPILLLAGVMLPLNLAPGWMRVIAHINPLYYVVEAGRDLAAGNIHTHAIGLAFAVITPLTVLVLIGVTRTYKKAVA